MLRFGWWRRFLVVWRILPPFFAVAFTKDGLFSPAGRQLIWGKARRAFLSLSPALSKRLQAHYGVQGGCTSCGSSCNLLFQCPHWDSRTHLCSVYEDRPNICRLFPITPADIKDRDLVKHKDNASCGFAFSRPKLLAPARPAEESTTGPLVPSKG